MNERSGSDSKILFNDVELVHCTCEQVLTGSTGKWGLTITGNIDTVTPNIAELLLTENLDKDCKAQIGLILDKNDPKRVETGIYSLKKLSRFFNAGEIQRWKLELELWGEYEISTIKH